MYYASKVFEAIQDIDVFAKRMNILYYKMDIDKLLTVQSRMTKMIPWIRNLTYKNIIKHLHLHTLERRRVNGDLTKAFKRVEDFNRGDINKVFMVKEKLRT